MAKVFTPVKGFTGWRANVYFTRGVAEITDRKQIEWFREHGYKITHDEVNVAYDANGKVDLKRNKLDEMSLAELRVFAKELGYPMLLKDVRSRPKAALIMKAQVAKIMGTTAGEV